VPRLDRRHWIIGAVLVVFVTAAVHYGLAWHRGDDIHIPGGPTVRRFPCSAYELPAGNSDRIQAYALIDGAALAAQSNAKGDVNALVDVVFDRELLVRCGNPLRRRVKDAEWRFRQRAQPPIAEHTLVDVANEVLASAGAPAWARTSIEEVHVLRTALQPELPRLIGTVSIDLRRSDQMSPVEAVFIAMQLGTGMLSTDDFRGGPDAYLQRMRERQLNPPTTGARASISIRSRVVVQGVTFDISNLDSPKTELAKAAQQLLDRLGFPA
jgi:hypothetical protein